MGCNTQIRIQIQVRESWGKAAILLPLAFISIVTRCTTITIGTVHQGREKITCCGAHRIKVISQRCGLWGRALAILTASRNNAFSWDHHSWFQQTQGQGFLLLLFRAVASALVCCNQSLVQIPSSGSFQGVNDKKNVTKTHYNRFLGRLFPLAFFLVS